MSRSVSTRSHTAADLRAQLLLDEGYTLVAPRYAVQAAKSLGGQIPYRLEATGQRKSPGRPRVRLELWVHERHLGTVARHAGSRGVRAAALDALLAHTEKISEGAWVR